MSCNPKMTGSGKVIGESGASDPNARSGAGVGGNQSGSGSSGSAGNGSSSAGEKLPQDTTVNNIKFNKDRTDEIRNELKELGYSDVQIAAVLGHWKNESNFNTGAKGDGGTSFGLAQWHKDRWNGPNGLLTFAQKNNMDPYAVSTQVRFFDWELNNTEKSAGYALKNATTVAEASWAMNKFERFAGYKDANGAQTIGRLRNANTFYEYYSKSS